MDLMQAHGGDLVDIFDMSKRDQEIVKSISKPRFKEGDGTDNEDKIEFPAPVLMCFKDICNLMETELKWVEDNPNEDREFRCFNLCLIEVRR